MQTENDETIIYRVGRRRIPSRDKIKQQIAKKFTGASAELVKRAVDAIYEFRQDGPQKPRCGDQIIVTPRQVYVEFKPAPKR